MNCKDCRYFDTEDGKEGYCQEFIYPVNDKCFCNIDLVPPEKPKPDIVEVVRCKDCKYNPSGGILGELCPFVDYDGHVNEFPNDDFYCKRGERREDAEIH